MDFVRRFKIFGRKEFWRNMWMGHAATLCSAVGLAPLSKTEARSLLGSLKGAKLFAGFRGQLLDGGLVLVINDIPQGAD